jgi:hypothetical protein
MTDITVGKTKKIDTANGHMIFGNVKINVLSDHYACIHKCAWFLYYFLQ